MAVTNNKASIIGSTTVITGNVSGRGDLRVDGTVKGGVTVDGQIEVMAEASIEGPIEGNDLFLQGRAQGDVVASGTVSLGPRAQYSGVIRAANVTIAPGARVAADLDTGFDLHLNI